jgi:hypothetical protein
MSLRHVLVHTCCVSMSVLHSHVHAACICPCCKYISMLMSMCSCKCPCQDMEMQHGPDYTTTTIQSFYFLYIFTLHTVYFSTSIDKRYSTFPASLLLEEQNVHTIATDTVYLLCIFYSIEIVCVGWQCTKSMYVGYSLVSQSVE